MSRKFNYQKALDEGHTDEEIFSYLSKENPKFNAEKSLEDGHDHAQINQYLSSIEKRTHPKEQLEDALKGAGRKSTQLVKGAAEFTPYGVATSLWEIFGKGEAQVGLEELEEDLPRLKKLFPDLNWPEEIDKEKYAQAAKTAVGLIPTIENISGAAEEITGLPFKAESKTDENLKFFGGAAKLASGSPAQKIGAALKMLMYKIRSRIGRSSRRRSGYFIFDAWIDGEDACNQKY